MNIKNKVRSPILLFILMLFGIELFLRLPYVLNVQANPYLNRKADLSYFSDFNSGTVIFTGLMLLACAFVVVSITAFFNKGMNYSTIEIPIPKIPVSYTHLTLPTIYSV